MLVVETIAEIRRAFLVEGKSIKQICRDLRLSRNTVGKVIRSGDTAFSYDRSVQPRPKINPWKDQLDEVLADNAGKPKRERLNLVRISEELRNLGYDGSCDAVRRYAATWSRETQEASASAYVPLSFDPGEAYQFDWSHEFVLIDGVTTTVKVAHVCLWHSRMSGFIHARLRRWSLTPITRRLRSSVGPARVEATITRPCTPLVQEQWTSEDGGRHDLRQERPRLQPRSPMSLGQLASGQVENQVGVIRRRFFVPRPMFKSSAELNARLEDRCTIYAKANKHPDLRDKTIWEVFEEERVRLVPNVGLFDGF